MTSCGVLQYILVSGRRSCGVRSAGVVTNGGSTCWVRLRGKEVDVTSRIVSESVKRKAGN